MYQDCLSWSRTVLAWKQDSLKLSQHKAMATPGGLQPPTSALGKPCSMQLSYGATASLPKGGCRVREAPAVSRRFTGRAQRFRLVVKSR